MNRQDLTPEQMVGLQNPSMWYSLAKSSVQTARNFLKGYPRMNPQLRAELYFDALCNALAYREIARASRNLQDAVKNLKDTPYRVKTSLSLPLGSNHFDRPSCRLLPR